MDRIWVIAAWGMVLVLASWLRFENLGSRPFHADEATGAKITASRMSGEGGHFDPKHYHGPALGDAAWVACRVAGERDWKQMTKETLRCVAAVAGVCVVLLPVFWRRRVGDHATLLAGGVLAVSPLLVYYSRMFIHEMLLVLAGGAVLACFAGTRPRFILAGVFLGLMFAIKETFVISMLAWCGAWVLVLAGEREWRSRARLVEKARQFAVPFAGMAVMAVLVSMLFYTRCFTYPRGAWDAVRTFFVYETVSGHEKPWWWYVAWSGWPVKAAGVWWIECALLWVALLVFLASWIPRLIQKSGGAAHLWIRFLGLSFLAHLAIYSGFGYKTPWLMCLPWLHVCVLAGFGVALLPSRISVMAGVMAAGILLLWPMSRLSGKACGRLSSDPRNPYAYVPTVRDVEGLERFLNQLRPLADQDVVAVIGTDYWPLPWYLRSFGQTGYWAEPPAGVEKLPIVLVMPDALDRTNAALAASHTLLPRGLRAEVPLWLMVRNDVWGKWMEVGR